MRGSIAQARCNPEHHTDLLLWRHRAWQDRDFPAKDYHGSGTRKELFRRCPLRIKENLDADAEVDIDPLLLKEHLKIYSGTSWLYEHGYIIRMWVRVPVLSSSPPAREGGGENDIETLFGEEIESLDNEPYRSDVFDDTGGIKG